MTNENDEQKRGSGDQAFEHKGPVGITNRPSEEISRQEEVVKDRPEGQAAYEKIKEQRG